MNVVLPLSGVTVNRAPFARFCRAELQEQEI